MTAVLDAPLPADHPVAHLVVLAAGHAAVEDAFGRTAGKNRLVGIQYD